MCMSVRVRAYAALPVPARRGCVLQPLAANKTQGRLELQQPLNASNHVKQLGIVECLIA